MLSVRDVVAILAFPERTVRDEWREWGLPAYRIGKHVRWRERDVYGWIDRQAGPELALTLPSLAGYLPAITAKIAKIRR